MSGTCYDHGLFPINDAQVCGVASWRLRRPDISPSIHHSTPSTEGCHYRHDASGPAYLSLNVNPVNKGHGFIMDEQNKIVRNPICSSVANHSMSNIVSKPGNCHATSPTEITEEYFACLSDTCTNYNYTIFHEIASAGQFGSFIEPHASIFKCAMLLSRGINCSSVLRNGSVSYRSVRVPSRAILGKSILEQFGNMPLSRFCPRCCSQCLTDDPTTRVVVDGATRLLMKSFLPATIFATFLLIAPGM